MNRGKDEHMRSSMSKKAIISGKASFAAFANKTAMISYPVFFEFSYFTPFLLDCLSLSARNVQLKNKYCVDYTGCITVLFRPRSLDVVEGSERECSTCLQPFHSLQPRGHPTEEWTRTSVGTIRCTKGLVLSYTPASKDNVDEEARIMVAWTQTSDACDGRHATNVNENIWIEE